MADNDPRRAVFTVFINGPIEKVWHEITKTDSPQLCMFNMKLRTPGLKVGAPIRADTKSGKYTGVVGEVLEFNPPHRYAHTFRFARFDDPPCKVTYDLREVRGGTEFTLTVDDIPVGTKSAKQMLPGCKLIVNTLKNVVETGRPSLGVRLIYTLMGALEFLSPKKTRVENWSI